MPLCSPEPLRKGRCGSLVPSQKQKGLSAGTDERNVPKFLKRLPAMFRPLVSVRPGPQALPVAPTW